MFGSIIKRVGVFLCALVPVLIPLPTRGQESPNLPCLPDTTSSSPCAFGYLPLVKSTGTTRGVALYACSTGAPTALPSWNQSIWSSYDLPQNSVARYYKDVSRGAYQLQITPYGRDASHSFVSSQSPGSNVGNEFIRDVIGQADTLLPINFAEFDNDGPNGIPANSDNCNDSACLADGRIGDDDGYVDAIFVLADGLQTKQYLFGSDYTTRDTGAHGQYIKVDGRFGVTALACEACLTNAYFQVVHDWGHPLGVRDLFGNRSLVDGYPPVPPEYLNWWVLGSFSIMGYPGSVGNRYIPYDPYSQIKLGWVAPSNIIEVDTPLYAESIPNFVTTGKIYKIKRSPTEYFLVTNHQGVNPQVNPAGYYEGGFTGWGLLIWHIDESGCYNDKTHKFIDVELAHGLWNYDPVTFLPDTSNPNPRYGRDSLDLGFKPGTLTRIGWTQGHPNQSFTCFWNPANNNKINFDGSSNPSSDGYRDSVINYIRVQDIPTLIGVRNIQSPAQFTTATADFLANSWYGNIRQNTTWGPGTVSVVGDVTVDSALTLTIQPGTTIKFRKNFDEMKSGGDTAKSRIVVKGTLTCVGTVEDSIILTSSATAPSNGDWGGVLFTYPGRGYLEHARISYADTAISVQGDTATVIVYNSTFTHFNTAAVYSKSYKTRLGGLKYQSVPPDCGRNNFLMNTATSGAKAVIKSSSPSDTLKAEGNWWTQTPPSSSWFSGKVDRTPYLLGYATPDSCNTGGESPQPPPEERIAVSSTLPITFELGQNIPNPFNPATAIRYALPEPARVELRIFNMLGQMVRKLVNEEKPAGFHEAVWDGRDETGRAVSTGIYLYRIKAGDFMETKRMSLIK